MTSSEYKLVHLDLKGAPPKFSYYKEIFPLLEKWGATGLLVEYEDMFPFADSLSDIPAPHAYTKEEVEGLQDLAAKHHLEVIPLLQTFGHFEFVLKHEKYSELREIPSYPMTLCPLKTGSMQLLKQMMHQVIDLHPHIKYFHIGADEVFHIGVCKACHKHMAENNLSVQQMFFMHMRNVLKYATVKYPHLRFIMWDDMFRHADLEVIKGCEIGDLVEPMVWLYHKNLDHLPQDMWDRYSAVFDDMWVATAFKGATGPCMFVTDISMHVENHRAWLKTVSTKVKDKFKHFRGYAVTGWQRYDHYAVLCELVPVGLPCLALCLLTLKKGSFTEEVHKQASEDLGFKDLIPMYPFQSIGVFPDCNFPGSKIYLGALSALQLKEVYKQFIKNDRLNGWMSRYHVRQRFANPAHIKHFLPEGQLLLGHLQQLMTYMEEVLSEVFYPDTVSEWLTTVLSPKIEEVTTILTNASQLLEIGARPKEVGSMDQT